MTGKNVRDLLQNKKREEVGRDTDETKLTTN